MDANELLQSKYLKASDLKGKRVTVTVKSVEEAVLGDKKERKLILFFEGKEKGMVVNKTNMRVIMGACGSETENWIGAKLALESRIVEFQGTPTDALRIAHVTPAPKSAQVGNEEVPF